MAIVLGLIPSEFTLAENLGWLRSNQWGTAGSDLQENVGNLNRPLNRLYGNTLWLKAQVESIGDDLEEHISDPEAHWDSIREWMDYESDEYFDTSLPGEKVKASLALELDEYSEVVADNRIEDAQVSSSADIAESKIDLSLREKQRTSQGTGYFNTTGDLAEDINTLFNLYGGSRSTFFDSLRNTIKSIIYSGWTESFPHLWMPLGENSIKTVKDAVILNKEKNENVNLNLHGIPVVLGNSGTDGEYEYPLFFSSDNIPFYFASSPNIYTASSVEESGRTDLVFLEMWIEDIEDIGDVALYGDVMCGAFDWFFDGTAPTESGLEDKFRYFHSPDFLNILTDDSASNPEHLVFSDSDYQPVQVRFRIVVSQGAGSMTEARPQCILPVPVDQVEEIEFSTTADPYVFELADEDAVLKMFTGNKVELSSGSLPFTHEGSLYVRRVSDTTIKLAETVTKCLGGNNSYFFAATGSGTFSLKCITGESEEIAEVIGTSVVEAEDTSFIISSASLDVSNGTPVHFELNSDNYTEYLNFEIDEGITTFVKYILRRISGNNFNLFGVDASSNETLLKIQFVDDCDDVRYCGKITFTENGRDTEVNISTYTYNELESGNEFFIIENRDWDGLDEVQVSYEISASFYIHSPLGELKNNELFYCNVDPEYGEVTFYSTREDYKNLENPLENTYLGCDPDEESEVAITITVPLTFSPSDSSPYEYTASMNLGGTGENYGIFGYPLFKVGRRNAGIFDPIYNPNGSAKSNGSAIESLSSCFNEDYILCYKQGVYDESEAKTITTIKADGDYSAEESTSDYYVIDGTKYFRSGYLASDSEYPSLFGISGRPDGLFYNSLHYSDIVDLRHKMNCCTDLGQIVNRNLDHAFRGSVIEELNTPTMNDQTESSVKSTTFLQRDVILADDSETNPYGKIIDEKVHRIVGDDEWSSYDGVDGVRRVWSDAPKTQIDTEIASFGNEVTDSNLYGDYFENFTSYNRVNAGDKLDIDYSYYKYIYFNGTTPAYKRALSGIRVYRLGVLSGDFYGAETDLSKKRVSLSDDQDNWAIYEVFENHDSSLYIKEVRTISSNSNILLECEGYEFEEVSAGVYKLYAKNNSDDYTSGLSLYTSDDGSEGTLVSIAYDEYSSDYEGTIIIGYFKDGIYTEEEIDVSTGLSDDATILEMENAPFTDYEYVTVIIPRPNETALVKVNPFRVPKPLKDDITYRIEVLNPTEESVKIRVIPFIPEDEDDYIEFEVDSGYINRDAKIQFIPQPVIINDDGTGSIKLEEALDISEVDESNKTIKLSSNWLTGTPVAMDNVNWFEDSSLETTDAFYIILKNSEIGTYMLALSARASIAYLRKVNITSTGSGSIEIYPISSSENINTRTHRSLLLNEDENMEFRSSFRSNQTWETGTPVYIQSFDELITPQHQYSDSSKEISVEEYNYIPVNEVNEYLISLDEDGSYINSCAIETEEGDCFFITSAGNDIPSGMSGDEVYYTHVVQNGLDGTTSFYLSESFFSALLGRKISCGGVITGGKLAISPCALPESEKILLGAGNIDTEYDTISVTEDWETGQCVSLSAFNNTYLPSGVDSDSTFFVEKAADGKIRLIQDFHRYFAYKVGEYEGITSPFDINLSATEESVLEDYFSVGVPQITHFELGGNVIFGGYTFTDLENVEIHGSNLDNVTHVRIGNNTLETGEFTVVDDVITLDIPAYAYDSLVEVSVKSGGIWTNVIYYQYFSVTATEKFYIYHINKCGSMTDTSGMETEITDLAIYVYYTGDIDDIDNDFKIYAERYGVRNTNLDADADETTTITIASDKVTRVKDQLDNDTPIIKIEFSYTPPKIETTVGATDIRQSITDFYLADAVSEDIASRNSISFSAFVDDYSESGVSGNISYIQKIDTPNGTDYLVPFGSNTYENRIRIVMPGYEDSTAIFEITDANGQWTEIVTGYRVRESISGTLTDVIYLELPRKIAVGNVNIHLATDENIYCESPYVNNDSPVVFSPEEEMALDGLYERVFDFYGYGLNSINRAFLRVYDTDGTEMQYYCNVSIIEKSEGRITVLMPRIFRIDDEDESTYTFLLDFISYTSGTATVEFELETAEYAEVPTVEMSYSAPSSIKCELDDEYVDYIVTNGSIDIEVFGTNLQFIEEVFLDVEAEYGAIEFEIVKKESDRMILRLPEITAGDEVEEGSAFVRFRTMFEDSVDWENDDNVISLTFVDTATYDIEPFISSVNYYEVNNYEETTFIITGNNLTDVTSIQVGTQTFDENTIEVTPGIAGAFDRLTVTLEECNDSGIVPVIVTTLYADTDYYTAYPVYITQVASPYVDFRTSGVGEIELIGKEFEESSVSNAISEDLNDLYAISQNLPTGLPVSIDAGSEAFIDKYVVNTGLVKARLLDSEGEVFDAYPAGTFSLIEVPQVYSDGSIEDDDEEGIGRFIDSIASTYVLDSGESVLLDRNMWSDGTRVMVHNNANGFPPTEDQIASYMSAGDIYDIDFVDNIYYVKFADSMLSAVSENPFTGSLNAEVGSAMFPANSKQAYGMFDHYEDGDQSSGDKVYGYINGASDVITQVNVPSNSCWVTGVPVRIGSNVVGVDEAIFYNVGDSDTVILSKSIQTIDYERFSSESYGFIEMRKTWPDLKPDNVYYIENIGSGRIRIYDSALNMVTDNPLEFIVNNEASLHFIPIMGEKVVQIGGEYEDNIDLVTDEIHTSLESVESGTPVRITLPLNAGDSDELPDGLEEGVTYFVYKSNEDSVSGTCAITLYRTYLDALLLEAYVQNPVNKNIGVTMTSIFEGGSVSQGVSNIDLSVDSETGLITSQIQLDAKSDLFLNDSFSAGTDLGLISGVPVRIVSDIPVFDETAMEDEEKELRVKYALEYEGSRGLTDRPYNTSKDARVVDNRTFSGNTQDKYVIFDGRYEDSMSTSGFEYWNVNSLTNFLEFFNVDASSEYVNMYTAYYNSIKYTDTVIPAPFNGTDIPEDVYTIEYGKENSLMGYDGEDSLTISLRNLLPANLRDKKLYVNFFVFKSSEISACFGVPKRDGSGDINAYSGAIVTTWDKDTDTILMDGIAEGDKVSFRCGITIIEDHELAEGASQGTVFDFNAQNKEISSIGVKRILSGATFGWDTGEYPGEYSWEFEVENTCTDGSFRDVLGYSGTCWEFDEEEEVYTLSFDVGGANFILNHGVCNLVLDTETNKEFLYVADTRYFYSGEYDETVAPPKENLVVYYNRNIQNMIYLEGSVEPLYLPNYVVKSLAGSGSEAQEGNIYQYPFLLFGMPLANKVSTYGVSGNGVYDTVNEIEVSYDSSFLCLKDVTIENTPYTETLNLSDVAFSNSLSAIMLNNGIKSKPTFISLSNKTLYPDTHVEIIPYLALFNGILYTIICVIEGDMIRHYKFKCHGNIMIKDF